jgi:hypothetical protein
VPRTGDPEAVHQSQTDRCQYREVLHNPLSWGVALSWGPCNEFNDERVAPHERDNCRGGYRMTCAIAFLLGSMFGACVGFMAAGAVNASRSETAFTAKRPYLRHPESGVPLVP